MHFSFCRSKYVPFAAIPFLSTTNIMHMAHNTTQSPGRFASAQAVDLFKPVLVGYDKDMDHLLLPIFDRSLQYAIHMDRI